MKQRSSEETAMQGDDQGVGLMSKFHNYDIIIGHLGVIASTVQ